jgi:hypothetical protein
MKKILLTGILTILLFGLRAQDQLGKVISIRVHGWTLARTLDEIGKKGGFYFSYNTNILKGDSLVSVNAASRPVREVLDSLLGGRYEYIESGRYVILQVRASAPSPPVTHGYTISGWVVDSDTKRRISRASIYAADQLISTLTDSSGFFRLRLKDKGSHATITVSKELYRDTFLVIRSGYDQEFTFNIDSARVAELMPFVVSSHVERTWVGRLFISSRQKIQSLNLLNFFANKPVQMSLTPGLGTRGSMGGQVVNKLSLNILGGYTAGSNGLELAGLFNIDKRDVNYVQAAGIFNVVGGTTNGVQLAGIFNTNLDSVKGVQAAGIANRVTGNMNGVQIAGIYNSVSGTVRGIQVSGIANRASRLKGVQVGLINVADTCDGVMVGLLNITKNGYHPLSISSDEILPVSLSYKAGGKTAYSILTAGADPRGANQTYMLGYGLGVKAAMGKRLTFSTELLFEYFYVGNWKDVAEAYRLQPALQWRFAKKMALFAGPAFSIFEPNHAEVSSGFRMPLPPSSYHTFKIGNNTAWFGWTAGINFF